MTIPITREPYLVVRAEKSRYVLRPVHDVIAIEGLKIQALIGIYPHERLARQPLMVDLRLFTDIVAAARQRDYRLTIDYERAANIAREVVGDLHHELVETVAENIADALKAEFAGKLAKVWVRVAKPMAVEGTRTVAIEIER